MEYKEINSLYTRSPLNSPSVVVIRPKSSEDSETSTSKSSSSDDLVKYFADFKITAIYSQNFGKVCRIKKFGCRHTHPCFNLTNTANSDESSINSSTNGSARSSVSKPRTVENGIVRKQSLVSTPHSSTLQSSPQTPTGKVINSKSAKKKKYQKKVKQFSAYWTKRDVEIGLTVGSLIQGAIRINQKNSCEAYVANQEQSDNDYLIRSVVDRNRALEGDIVVIRLNPESEWQQKYKTAIVVYIMEKVHSRMIIGHLTTKDSTLILMPRDKRLPKMKIPTANCSIGTNKGTVLATGKIISWTDVDYAEGIIYDLLGMSGNLNSENRAILAEHAIDISLYSSPLVFPDKITDLELRTRIDFRSNCIFTIDPLTARDLDDAVSCTELPNGNYRVGVHISDVSLYVPENSELDLFVRRRATSVYMVNDVIHMLPPDLCMRCSLLPGVDRRAFSVVWEMTKTGDIVNEYFVRSVINSCTQLAYDHAQLMIEDPNRVFQANELPKIYGGYTYKDLSQKINALQQIALNLRRRRFENGALRIEQTKVTFSLNPETGDPVEFFTYENKEANRLIEEFMLLANISVARNIEKKFPNLAFLRRHDPPKESMLVEIKKKLETYNIDLDISSSKALQASILQIGIKLGLPHMAVINHFLTKPMSRARYFCAETEMGNYEHYALHIPIYTHFTSPIRRYADIMVHRLLAASLGYIPKPTWNAQEVALIAANCNNKKYSAKLAGDASSDLYLAHYIQTHQPFIRSAVVCHVRDRSFEALVPSTGSIVRIKEEDFAKGMWRYEEVDERRKVIITFPPTQEYEEEQVLIDVFQTITISLDRKPNTNSLSGILLRPISSKLIRSRSAFQRK